MRREFRGLRLPPDVLAEIEVWRDRHTVGGERPSWSAAVRALIGAGLERREVRDERLGG